MKRPSLRKEMAVKAVAACGVSIALACRAFQISESCYRYERKLSDKNAVITDWLEYQPAGYCAAMHERDISGSTGFTANWS